MLGNPSQVPWEHTFFQVACKSVSHFLCLSISLCIISLVFTSHIFVFPVFTSSYCSMCMASASLIVCRLCLCFVSISPQVCLSSLPVYLSPSVMYIYPSVFSNCLSEGRSPWLRNTSTLQLNKSFREGKAVKADVIDPCVSIKHIVYIGRQSKHTHTLTHA